MLRPIPCLFVAVLATAATVSFGSEARAEEPRARVARAPVPLDGIAAVVDDTTIFRSEVIARARHFEDKLSKDPVKRRTELVDLQKQVLGRLIDEVLIAKDAVRLHLEVTGAEVAAGITSVAQSNNLDRKRLEAEVVKAGFTFPEYQEEIRRQILEQKWLMTRAAGKIERSKNPDPATFQAAIDKQRELLIGELRSHTFVEIR
jgi:parvulin-like peptidyl-prolyl isomerase